MPINTLLNQIQDGEIVLPAIQRDFVWPEEQITLLLDSVMRGYPIGIVLLWETYGDVQHRKFDRDFKSGNLHTFDENPAGSKLKVVLDGQQRLQSLFVALHGSFEGKYLFFDVLSGGESDDVSQERFIFTFAAHGEAEKWNSESMKWEGNIDSKVPDSILPRHFIRVSDIFKMGAKEKKNFVLELSGKLHLSADDQIRIELNFSTLDEALSKDENILKASVIDENRNRDSPDRKSESDVLEIFVRINTAGTPLSRSDLIFSMLKLNWKESAEALPEFIQDINEGNSLDLDTDFVIRCLFAVSDLGTKFDIGLLRKRSNVKKLQDNFERCCDAIRATVDFIVTECWCSSSRVLGGTASFIPLVYYLFNRKNHEVPNDQVDRIRKSVYLFGFARPFSRYADSRLGAFIRTELRPLVKKDDSSFPWEEAVWWVRYWERIGTYSEDLLQRNPILVCHLVQGLSGAQVQYKRNAPEMDHIFPRSVLREKGRDEALINNFANFWILAKGKNQNKSNRHPKRYFEDVSDNNMKRAHIDRDMLDYSKYRRFIKRRSQALLEAVAHKIGFSDEDFGVEEVE